MGGSSAIGATKFGAPSEVSLQGFTQFDPSKYAAFNTSPQYNAAAAQISANTGNQQQQALGRAAQLGAGRSAGTQRALQDVGAQGAQQLNQFGANAAQQSFQDQMQQWQGQNQYNTNLNQAQMQNFNNQNAAYQNEQANRRNALSAFGNAGNLVNLFSNY